MLTGFDPEIDLPFEGYLYIPKIVIQSVVEEEYFDDEEEDYDDNSYTVTSVSFVDGETHSMLRQTWEPHPTEQICYVEAFSEVLGVRAEAGQPEEYWARLLSEWPHLPVVCAPC